MKRNNGSFELSNGRIINPDPVIFGLSEREVITFGLYEIEPGQFAYVMKNNTSESDPPFEPDLTTEEAIEVADYMINEWTKFKDSIKQNT